MSDQNWRIQTDATDYFGQQKKAAAVESRRPVPRKPSDLTGLGPAINASAIRLDDLNDPLAINNGFFSARAGAANAPAVVVTTLTAARNSGTAYTNLAVSPIPAELLVGADVLIVSGNVRQWVRTSTSVAAGASSIPITSATMQATFPAGTTVRSSENFIGETIVDPEFGGVQVFSGFTSGVEYRRMFSRRPGDAETIDFGLWQAAETAPSSLRTTSVTATSIGTGTSVALTAPTIATQGVAAFTRTTTQINITRPGIYTGHIRFSSITGDSVRMAEMTVRFPGYSVESANTGTSVATGSGYYIPLDFTTVMTSGYIAVEARAATGGSGSANWRLELTRIGDAL